jgi:UDP-N-acetylmuramate--alanine ligase
VRFKNVRHEGATSIFDVEIRRRRTGQVITLNDLRLPMPGRHNVSNATAAIAVAQRLGVSEEAIARGLAGFAGVKRRFTFTGEWNGVQIFDDYGHHPVEIKAVLKAARESCQHRIIAIHQPHRYSRVASLFAEFASCFNDADSVFIAPIYSAGEDPIEGVTAEEMVSRIKSGGHRDVRFLATPDALAPYVAAIAQPGDFVVLLGAGSITNWAASLPKELAALSGKKA